MQEEGEETLDRIDDVLLLPTKVTYDGALKALQASGFVNDEGNDIGSLIPALIAYDRIKSDYIEERNTSGLEPQGFGQLPRETRKLIRLQYALEEIEDVFSLVVGLERTDLSYLVLTGGLCEDVVRAFNLWRLQWIRQLGFLQVPRLNKNILSWSLTQTNRYTHSLDVYMVTTVFGHALGLREVLRNTVGASALSHDFATVAGGDSVKLAAFEEYDEDLNYPILLDRIDITGLQRDYGISRELLLKTIRNEGLLGEVLDVADKIAYVARDLNEVARVVEPSIRLGHKGATQLRPFIASEDVCNLWKSVEVAGDHLVFRRVGQLVSFLRLRLHLFKQLYYHPSTRFGEFLVSRALIPIMRAEGKLNRDELVQMQDEHLKYLLTQRFGDEILNQIVEGRDVVLESFSTLQEARARRDELLSDPQITFAAVDDSHPRIKVGTHFFVATPKGPKRLREAYPGTAAQLEQEAVIPRQFHVRFIEEAWSEGEVLRDLSAYLLDRDEESGQR